MTNEKTLPCPFCSKEIPVTLPSCMFCGRYLGIPKNEVVWSLEQSKPCPICSTRVSLKATRCMVCGTEMLPKFKETGFVYSKKEFDPLVAPWYLVFAMAIKKFLLGE